jgi:signal transduction histidine kinase
MTRIRRRLAVHFTLQFVMLWVFVAVLLFTLFLVLLQFLANRDLERSFSDNVLDSLIAETLYIDGNLDIPSTWAGQLKKHGYWLQVIDRNGKVIRSENTPADLPASYTPSELLQIRENGWYQSYRVINELDNTTADEPLFFMAGVEDQRPQRLRYYFDTYSTGGRLAAGAEQALLAELEPSVESLHVMDGQGRIIQSVGGEPSRERYGPLELISILAEPGLHTVGMNVYADPISGYTWILQTDKGDASYQYQPLMEDPIFFLGVLAGSILLLTIGVAVWFGYRYGQPLLLFSEWFERMGQKRYGEALTEKDRRRVFQKNGKIRMRYRLYKEVIAGFYDMAEKLDATERERIRLERMREEWMAGISHDLRTPLSTIQGYGHLLESSPFEWTRTELEEMGKMIRSKGDYMLELLSDFSLTFQLRNHAQDVPREDIELNEFVRRTVLRYVNDVTLKDVSFAYEGEEEALTVSGTAKWFRRMLDNLLTNAVKHNPPGTEIKVSTSKGPGTAIIIIEDNGSGMDEETRRNLFERYYRGTNTDENTDGAGLGMSITKAIVESYQGSIEVDSRVGEGTVIRITFPSPASHEETDKKQP